jgi:preprotein translocase subunit SecE
MKTLISFVKESYKEILTNVTWPSYKELQTNAIVVLLASLLFALVIGIIDISFKTIMEKLYQSFN